MTLPFFGEIDTKKSSLFVMSSILGFIDGFNPCAMWVLLTFLIILSQIGDRRKMVYLAGLFILAEGIMYFLILNVWYQTWDFIQLDQWVTPMVGVIAIGGGGYFLYKYYKNKDGHLTCEVTSLEHQQKTVAKIKEVVSKPITIVTTLAVLGIAFSVNIIEFACSVGIAQSFTKILELNDLSFILRQWYIFIYSLFYMADDFLIFGLAIFGYQKFTTVGTKYSHLSSLLGGILMIILGLLLILKPEWLG
jgi:cytochrome c biogenesis protein CcdA